MSASQSSLFGSPVTPSVQTRRTGVDKANAALAALADKHSAWIAECRQIAEAIALSCGVVSADDVRPIFEKRHGAGLWGNWCGSIFHPCRFEWTGEVKRSEADNRRGGVVRVWRVRS